MIINEETGKIVFCPECGNLNIREPYKDGHYQCEDRECLQEFFDGVDYNENIAKKLKRLKELETNDKK